jgi:fatty-acid desaturase
LYFLGPVLLSLYFSPGWPVDSGSVWDITGSTRTGSYRVPLILEYFFALFGTLALQGGPIFWVGTHRIHHKKSDQRGDPHSPRDGAWWAHTGWILFSEPDQIDTATMSKYAPDLVKHRFTSG